MKFLLFVPFLVAFAIAKPLDQNVAVSQDTVGNYRLALNVVGHSRVEQGNADGTVSGSYSYTDPNGIVQTVQYTAGPDGFRVTGSNLPVAPIPVQETAEVAQARALHLEALATAEKENPSHEEGNQVL